ncbi:MAG: hypothetical protein ABI723_10680 [Bacteroidia bacterium]
MAELFIPFRLTPGAIGVNLRQLRGVDELSLDDIRTKSLLNLLQSLITPVSNEKTVNNLNAEQIVTADRDRILAALYISLYGSKVESTISCESCKQLFDLDFSLNDLVSHYESASTHNLEDGSFELEPGVRFRFPTGEDEMMINGFSQGEAEKVLLQRCLLEGDPETEKEKVELKMAEMAPVLNIEMEAHCPECNYTQQVRFDLQSFFLMKLKQERPRLINEIHRIASHYHWSQQVILDLPRSLRKQFVTLIESEM